MEALLPSGGLPDGHELNSHGFVSFVAGRSNEPVPDSFSAGAEMTTDSPALVRAS